MLRSLGSGSSGTVKEVVHIPSGELMAVLYYGFRFYFVYYSFL